jgi:hypothetical protein
MRLGMHAAAEVACNGVGVAEEHARSFRLKVQGSGFRVGIPKHITRAPKREHQSAPILFTGIPKHITRAPKREHQSAPILFTGIPKHITRAPKREHQSAQAW